MNGITLRIINDKPENAAFNMSADNFLLKNCPDYPDTVFVRFYQWLPPAISTGYMQDANIVLNTEACGKNGINIIKRPTGGRAVMHMEDLTYSCVFSLKIAEMGGSISKTYKIISECLMAGLALAGIDCHPCDSVLDAAQARRETRLPCFLAPNRREIMYRGRKLAGSAQKRTISAVLQHGSIPLTPAFRRLPEYENISEEQKKIHAKLLSEKCVCISEISQGVCFEKLRDFLSQGFEETLAIAAEKTSWSREEEKKIRRNHQRWSAGNNWTNPSGNPFGHIKRRPI